jgi:hypothetical protein
MTDEKFIHTKAALQGEQDSQDGHYRSWLAGTTARARNRSRGAI